MTTLVDKLVGAGDDTGPPRSDRRVSAVLRPLAGFIGRAGVVFGVKTVSPTDFAKEMQSRRSRLFINGMAEVSRCEITRFGQ